MRAVKIFGQRLRSMFRRERELSRELQLHLDQLVLEQRTRGLSEEEAQASARKEFGSAAMAMDECRDARGLRWWHDLISDARHAARSLRRTPTFALTAIVTIALGIGVNTAVFSLIHEVLLDPLPYRDPERLVHIASMHPAFPSFQAAAPDLADWQKDAQSFDQIAGHTFQAVNKWTILGDGDPEPVQVVQASHQLFGMLGVEPILGRRFTAEDERSKAPVVMLSESLWRRKYHADAKIVGRQIRLMHWPVTVIGVLSRRQAYPEWGEIWMPLCFLEESLVNSRRFRALEVVARLKSGVTIEQAQAEMAGLTRRQALAYPDTNGSIGVNVVPLDAWMTGQVRPALVIAWCAAALVLLLACANVAHLVLVRTAHRSRELAVRAALGAGTWRLTRSLLVENLAIAALGGLLGVLLARFVLPLVLRDSALELPRFQTGALSPTALIFGAVAALLCGAISALPALLTSRRMELHQAIKQSAGLSFAHRRSWIGPSVIIVEVALTFLVLTGAGLLYRSFARLLAEDPGFRSHGVLVADVPLAISHEEGAKVLTQRLLPALRALPGVTTVGAANTGPAMLRATETSRFASRFGIGGRSFAPGAYPVAQMRWITPDYFRALDIPLKAGRFFTDSDFGRFGILINDTLARRYFPGVDPIGRQILMNVTQPQPQPYEITGVVGDVRDLTLDSEARPTLYTYGITNKMTVLIRTSAAPASLGPAVRRLLREIRPEAPIQILAPLDDLVASSHALRRFALTLMSLFALLAALLTAVGVYGVISYSLSGRVREFAIRFALGARSADVCLMVGREFIGPALAGLIVGAGLLLLSAQAARTQLYKLSPADPLVLAAAAGVLVLLVLIAAFRPAAQAASVSPATLLRE